ncbi:MAG: phosphoesterase [Gammaproteobacteria bacterium]|nr:phosphoesterase [Gammaproteobacteria bacterium]MBV8403105.1 phosphoesterase [Gammaproteobacteria bacterium]
MAAHAFVVAAGLAASAVAAATTPVRSEGAIPRYTHVFVIVAENKGYDLIIGPHTVAPNINRLAQQYGLASQFFAEVHPSEGNYIAMLAGDTLGVHDDDAYYCKPGTRDTWCTKSQRPDYVDHTFVSRSLMDQLQARGLTWKAYMESLPEPGSLVVRWPTADKPVPGVPEQLYAAKHNGFVNFRTVQQDPARAAKIVDFDALYRDLANDAMPSYAHIVPNQCNDMHGRDAGPTVPADCRKTNREELIARGDRVIGELVARIMTSGPWRSTDNTAIVITFDENDKEERRGPDQGCCGNDPGSAANSGGGRIPTVVITNHGPRNLVDATPYNHYSLLRTTEAAFGIDEYLGHAADERGGVLTMAPLFAVRR